MVTEHTNSQQHLVSGWVEEFRPFAKDGQCANYIPALAEKKPLQLAISIVGPSNNEMKGGDTTELFTLQSVSKVVTFILACMDRGLPYVLERVDVEPTGDTFNSIIRLESHRPGKLLIP